MEEIKKRKWIRKVYGDNAGLHVIAEIESHFSDEELTKLAQGIGIRIYPISEYYIDKNKVPEYPGNPFRIWRIDRKGDRTGIS